MTSFVARAHARTLSLTLLIALLAPALGVTGSATPTGQGVSFTLYGALDLSSLVYPLATRYGAPRPDTRVSISISTLHPGFDNACGRGRSISRALGAGAGAGVIGVSDVFIQNDQIGITGCQDMINVPVAIGAVPVVYNLPGLYFNERGSDGSTPAHPVRLTAPVVTDILTGTVTRWDDPEIARLNPGAPLPHARIRPVVSADPGGIGFVFDQWLAASDPCWTMQVDTTFTDDPTVRPLWAPTVALTGTDRLAVSTIVQTPYSLGFTSAATALRFGLQTAALRNAAGAFVTPSPTGEIAAAAGALRDGMPRDFRKPIVASSDPQAFDPSYFAFLMVHRDQDKLVQIDAAHGGLPLSPDTPRTLKDFLTWSLDDHGGQPVVASLEGFAPMSCMTKLPRHSIVVPCALTAAARALVTSMTTVGAAATATLSR